MKKFFTGLQKAEDFLIGWLLCLMVIIVFAATVGRYTKLFSLFWAQEAASYMMIWVVFLGAGVVAGHGDHYGVDIVVANLPPLGKKICYVLQDIVVTGFCLFVVRYGMANILEQRAKGQLSPTLQIPIWIMYTAIVIGCALVIIQYVYHSVLQFRALNEQKQISEDSEEGGNAE